MDNLKYNTVNNSPKQKIQKTDDNQLERAFRGYTHFQIIVATLMIVPVLLDLMSHGIFFFSTIAAVFLVPLFVISVAIEIITVLVIIIADKINSNKTQKYSSAVSLNVEPSIIQGQQTKRMKASTKQFIVLLSLLAIIAVLSASNYFLPKYSAISKTFSREEKQYTDGSFRAEIIKNDPLGGIMTIRLDDDITFDYVCEVNPAGIDSGYGPFCRHEFPDDSRSIGEFIFRKNYSNLQELLTKYQDTLIADNSDHIFFINDQEKLKLFFSELMQNNDFSKAYKAFLNSYNQEFLASIDYIRIENVQSDSMNNRSGKTGLFEWADKMNLESLPSSQE